MKSLSYCLAEVEAGRADLVDPADHSKGIVCRAFLYRGEKLKSATPDQFTPKRNALSPYEVPLTQFKDPSSNSALRYIRRELIVRAEAYARLCASPAEIRI